MLEEGCHLLYCPGETGSATCSPDTQWKRFFRESGWKIGSESHGPVFACFVQRYHYPWSLLNSSLSEAICMVCFCNFIPLIALLFCPSDCELRFTINWISEKAIVNTCIMFTLRVNFLATSLPRIPGHMVLPCRAPWATPFLDRVVRATECIQSWFVTLSSGFAFNQEMSESAVDHSLIPIEKTLRTLYLRISFAQLEYPHYPIRGSSPSNCC